MTPGGTGPVMSQWRVEKVLESGFRWAKTKMMRGRNMKKGDMGSEMSDFEWCLGRIHDELKELEDVLRAEDTSWEDVCKECADIINFCSMMCCRAEENI